MPFTTTSRARWFYVRLLMTGLLAAMLVIGRLPAAGALEEAPADDTVELQAAQNGAAPVEDASEMPTEVPATEAPATEAPAEELPAEQKPVSRNSAPTEDSAPTVTVDAAPTEDATVAPSTKDATTPKKSSSLSSPQLTQPVPTVDEGDITSSGKVTLQQWKNKPSDLGWRSGNLGTSNSEYGEGDAVAFRTTIEATSPGNHTLQIEWDTTKGGKHSYDYLTGYDFSEAATPCTGQPLCTMAKSGPSIPVDSTVQGFAASDQFAISGGTVTGISAVTKTGTYAGDSSASVIVTFNATSPNVVLAWGGHIASPLDWGAGTTAGNINGSSYHMRVLKIDTSQTGKQDRSLAANAVIPAAALTMAKTASDTTPAIGQAFTYTVTLSNSGNADATGVTVSDLVPAIFDVTNVATSSSTGTCGFTGQQVSCSNLTVVKKTLAGNGTTTVTISVDGPLAVDCGQAPTNTASSNQAADASVVVTTPACVSALTMAKTASDTTPGIGQAFTYTVTLSNSGYADATAVTVSDAVPAIFDVTNVVTSSSAGSCGFTNQQVECTGLTVPKKVGATNGTTTVTISVDGPVASDCGKAPTNTASSNQAANASVVVTTPACVSSLTMAKTASDTTPAIGQAFTYTVTLSNSGYADATAVTVSDAVPAIFDVTNVATSSSAGSCGFTDQQVECTGLTVPKKAGTTNGTTTVTISVDGPVASDCGKAPTNTASSNQAANASVVVTTPGCFSALSLAKTASDTTPAIGQAFTYTVTLSNSGFADATAVTVSDAVPAIFDVTNVATSSSTGSCGFTNQQVECTGLTVAKKVGGTNGTTTVTISVDGPVASDCGKAPTNTASSNQAPSGSVVVTTPACFSSLSMAKTASDTTPAIGQAFTYTVTLTNTGYADATAVTVSDLVPAIFDVTNVTTSSGVGTCGFVGQQVDCTGLTVPKKVGATNGTTTVTISVDGPVASDCGKAPTNTASSNQAANASVVVTTPACFSALTMAKTASDTTPAIGQAFSYTVTLSNSGYADATGVSVSDLVPTIFDVTKVATSSGAGTCGFVGQQVDCTGLTVPKKVGATNGTTTVTISVDGPAASDCSKAPTNTASSNQAANASVVVTAPACFSALTMAKTASDTTPAIGQAFSYTITLTNTGYADATGVDVSDAVPPIFDVTNVATSSATGSCGFTNQQVECTGLTVPKKVGATNGTTTVTISVDGPVASNCGKAPTNTASSNQAANASVVVTTPGCFSDLTMDKTASDTTPAIGQAFSYTITLTNTGYADATGVDVSDAVPPIFAVTGVATSSAAGTCGFAGQQVDCTGLTVPKKVGATNGTTTITIDVNGPAAPDCGQSPTNTATSNQAANASVIVTAPACFADLTMDKTSSELSPAIGQAFSYTITLTNKGYADATGIDVSDAVPGIFAVTGVTTSSSTGTCAALGQQVDCSNLSVPKKTAAGDGTTTITIDVNGPAAPDCGQSPTNTATSNQAANASVIVTTPACFSDLALAKTNSNPAPQLGEDFTYTVTYTNVGYADATAVSFSDLVPAAFAVTGVTTSSSTGTCAALGQQVDCSNLTVPKKTAAGDGSMTVTISVDGPTAADCGQTFINAAASDGGTSVTGALNADDDPGVTTPACVAPAPKSSIKVVKTAATDEDGADVGEEIVYTYVITNTGDTVLTDISLMDDVIGVILGSAAGESLAAGEELTLTSPYIATEADGQNKSVTNVATATGQPPAGPAVTGTDTVSVPVGFTLVEDPGFITVTKSVIGVHEDQTYTYSVDCGPVVDLGKEATFTLPANGGGNEIGVGIPVGTECKIVETNAGGADATTVAVDGGEAQDGRSAIATVRAAGTTVAFTNAFDAAPVPEPRRPLPDPDPQPKPEPPPTLPATGADTMMQLLVSLAALLLGGTLIRVTRPRSRGWLRA